MDDQREYANDVLIDDRYIARVHREDANVHEVNLLSDYLNILVNEDNELLFYGDNGDTYDHAMVQYDETVGSIIDFKLVSDLTYTVDNETVSRYNIEIVIDEDEDNYYEFDLTFYDKDVFEDNEKEMDKDLKDKLLKIIERFYREGGTPHRKD